VPEPAVPGSWPYASLPKRPFDPIPHYLRPAQPDLVRKHGYCVEKRPSRARLRTFDHKAHSVSAAPTLVELNEPTRCGSIHPNVSRAGRDDCPEILSVVRVFLHRRRLELEEPHPGRSKWWRSFGVACVHGADIGRRKGVGEDAQPSRRSCQCLQVGGTPGRARSTRDESAWSPAGPSSDSSGKQHVVRAVVSSVLAGRREQAGLSSIRSKLPVSKSRRAGSRAPLDVTRRIPVGVRRRDPALRLSRVRSGRTHEACPDSGRAVPVRSNSFDTARTAGPTAITSSRRNRPRFRAEYSLRCCAADDTHMYCRP